MDLEVVARSVKRQFDLFIASLFGVSVSVVRYHSNSDHENLAESRFLSLFEETQSIVSCKMEIIMRIG